MSTETNVLKKPSIWKSLFGNNEEIEAENTLDDIENEEVDTKTMKALKSVLLSRKAYEQEVEEYINKANKEKEEVSNIKNVINAKSQAAMRKYYNEIMKEQEKTAEKADDDLTR